MSILIEDKTQGKKREILSASKEVFRQFGLSKVTMDDIARASKMGRSTLYYYYKNKMEVFLDLISEEFMDVIIPATDKVRPANSLKENLVIYTSTKLERLQLKEKQYYHLIQDLRDNRDIFFQIHNISTEKEFQIYNQIILWGIENGDVPEMTDSDREFLVKTIVTALSALEKEFFLFDAIDDLNSRLDWLANLLVKGLQY
ncbi:TetR/AcrR family transcriptional regulator [Neptunitalea lumnitzerae]|uniref:HTH tetR-type domain-containing protein n=1 Tax=Neptunitalea lumnitzerae TaxID=2965509 RepID=A0ABQ5MJS1_9FLAO|nr:TetR/AcrR family transcriptional regulator [Neptunitalea sp. Y10]GLB49182.1 hypothetical protein Y10_15500 [Neptunitalea sp. Y10]